MSFFKRILLKIVVGVFGFYLGSYLLEGVSYSDISSLILAGSFLGFVNFFIRPFLKLISFPIRLLTLGLFTFFINTAIVWFVKELFVGILIVDFYALVYTTVTVWVLEFTTQLFLKK